MKIQFPACALGRSSSTYEVCGEKRCWVRSPNSFKRKHVIDHTTVYTAVYGHKQTVIYGTILYRNRNHKPSLKVLDGYGYGPRITDPYDAIVQCTVTSPIISVGILNVEQSGIP